MSADSSSNGNVKQVVPFLRVSDMERSVRFYVKRPWLHHKEQVGG
jgi:hypothetical protein